MKYAYLVTLTLPGPRMVDSCCTSRYLDRATGIYFNRRRLADAVRKSRTGLMSGTEFRMFRMPRSVYGRGGWDVPTFRHAAEEVTLRPSASTSTAAAR